MDLARETSKVVHPLANQARCSHVDFNSGSSGLGPLGVGGLAGVGLVELGLTTIRVKPGFGLTGVAAAQRTRVGITRIIRYLLVAYWCDDFKRLFCCGRIEIGHLGSNFARVRMGINIRGWYLVQVDNIFCTYIEAKFILLLK